MKIRSLIFPLIIAAVFLAGCASAGDAGRDTQTSVLTSSNTSSNMTTDNRNLDATGAKSLIAANEGNTDFTILDVRTPDERTGGCIKNSLNVDFYNASFADELSKLDKSKTYLVYCRSGRRSGESVKLMEGMGFENVYNLDGGIGAWQENGGELAGTC